MANAKSVKRMWKAFESEVAKDFGTVRNPLSGKNSGHKTSSDSLHAIIYIEAKRDQSYLGKKLLDLLDDTFVKAKVEKKIPVIALKRKGKRGYIVLCRADDLEVIAREQFMGRYGT